MTRLPRFLLASVGCAALCAAASPRPAAAQGLGVAGDEPVHETASAPMTVVTAGPTVARATAGIRAEVVRDDRTRAQAAEQIVRDNAGNPTKGTILLIIGGAAFAGGLVLGGTGGAALGIAGALVALYGIYLLLQ
jgi:hypothetical protein